MNVLTIVVIVIAAIAVVFAVVMYIQKQRSSRLRARFGPEYDRLVDGQGNQRRAEEELLRRQKRIEKFHIRGLNQAEIERFSSSWRTVQAQFVDTPKQSVAEADRLVHDVMTTRGYPMANFEQSAADISVDHPGVVQNYRAAHDIAARDTSGKATTEDLRQAMVHYRALFEELLTTTDTYVEEVKR